jgi:hypothetical protein
LADPKKVEDLVKLYERLSGKAMSPEGRRDLEKIVADATERAAAKVKP